MWQICFQNPSGIKALTYEQKTHACNKMLLYSRMAELVLWMTTSARFNISSVYLLLKSYEKGLKVIALWCNQWQRNRYVLQNRDRWLDSLDNWPFLVNSWLRSIPSQAKYGTIITVLKTAHGRHSKSTAHRNGKTEASLEFNYQRFHSGRFNCNPSLPHSQNYQWRFCCCRRPVDLFPLSVSQGYPRRCLCRKSIKFCPSSCYLWKNNNNCLRTVYKSASN